MGEVIDVADFGKIYLDASLYIYYFEDNPEFSAQVENILLTAARNGVIIIASQLLLMELLVAPLREGDKELIRIYRQLDNQIANMKMVDFTRGISLTAAEIRAEENFSTPDSIHLATALAEQVDCFLTPDKQLKRFEDLTVVTLKPSV